MGSILVIQTDPTSTDSWATAISTAGHVVQVASNAREAMPLINDGGIDVVVIDAYDPRVGIADLAQKIAALPDAPPIVLVSSSPHAPEISARIGATAFLPKPCDPAELVAVLDRLVSQNRPVLVVEDDPSGPARQFG